MRNYEFVVIYSSQLNDSELKSEVDKFTKLAVDNGAENFEFNSWGKRELAYMLKKQKFGNYVSYGFATDNHDLIEKISGNLRINDKVLKFQPHRLQGTAKGDEGADTGAAA